jgi:hypothetical protein
LAGLEVFLTLASSVRCNSNAAPPLSLLSPTESDRTWSPPNASAASSPRVRSPTAHAAPEARFTRVYLARHLPASGFLTLLPVCFLQNLPALFHAGSAHGVFLQGLSPSQSLRPLSGSVPFVAFASAGVEPQETCCSTVDRACRLQGFALCEDSTSFERG